MKNTHDKGIIRGVIKKLKEVSKISPTNIDNELSDIFDTLKMYLEVLEAREEKKLMQKYIKRKFKKA
jgi:hypothetical protein